jgi:hypothetical protein
MAGWAGDVNWGWVAVTCSRQPRADLTAGARLTRRLSLISHGDR